MQVTHKVGSIEFCYIFLTFVLLQRNTPCHCMKPASVFGVFKCPVTSVKNEIKVAFPSLDLKKNSNSTDVMERSSGFVFCFF